MKSSYKSIKEYVFGEHENAFSILLEALNQCSLSFFLIGAQARDVHFFQQGIRPSRGTRDIDFAVMVDTMDRFTKVTDALVKRGFERTRDPYRLNWNQGETVIDLLPFGQVEEEYTVSFTDRQIEISVLGFRELNEELVEYFIDKDKSVSIPVPPLHGLFILKLLSWDEKKPGREKDLEDLNMILENYWHFVEDEAFERHLDLFVDGFKTEVAGARILGRHLRTTLSKSNVLKTTILRILEEQAKALDPPGLLLRKFAGERDKPIDAIKEQLDEIIKGVNE